MLIFCELHFLNNGDPALVNNFNELSSVTDVLTEAASWSFVLNSEKGFTEDSQVENWYSKNSNWYFRLYFQMLGRFGCIFRCSGVSVVFLDAREITFV